MLRTDCSQIVLSHTLHFIQKERLKISLRVGDMSDVAGGQGSLFTPSGYRVHPLLRVGVKSR